MCVSSPMLSEHSVCDPASPRHSNDRARRLFAVPVGDVFQDAGKPAPQALSQDKAGSPVEEHASRALRATGTAQTGLHVSRHGTPRGSENWALRGPVALAGDARAPETSHACAL